MSEFKPCFDRTVRGFEGWVIENVKGDKGGQTCCGISKFYNPVWTGWTLIDGGSTLSDSTLVQLIEDFYETAYWNRNHLGDLISQQLAFQVFDAMVNIGTHTVAKALQSLVSVTPDGLMGQLTTYACNVQSEDELVSKFLDWRKKFYADDVERHQSLSRFLKGWLKRCELA